MSKATELLERLLDAHEAYYDVRRGYEFGGRAFPGYAEFHTHGEKYVLSKKAKIWEVDAHEYIFFDVQPYVDAAAIERDAAFMATEALAKVDPVPDHMTSYLTLVVITDAVAPDVPAKVRRTRFRKNFLLGIRGWADLRLAVIDLQANNVYTNGQGREIQGSLEANLRKLVPEPLHDKALEEGE